MFGSKLKFTICSVARKRKVSEVLEVFWAQDTQRGSVWEDGFVRRTGTQEDSFWAGQTVPLSYPWLYPFIKNKVSC